MDEVDKLMHSNCIEAKDDERNYYIILMNGRRIRVYKGKMLWKSKSAASASINKILKSSISNKIYEKHRLLNKDAISYTSLACKEIQERITNFKEKNIQIITLKEYWDSIEKLKAIK